MIFLLLPLIFLIQKPVITKSTRMGSLLRRDRMGEPEFILKIIVMTETGQLLRLSVSSEAEIPSELLPCAA